MLGIKIFITGDVKKKLNQNKPIVIILNHRTRFDWLFLSSLLLRIGSLQKEKIILKDSLKYIPLFGESSYNTNRQTDIRIDVGMMWMDRWMDD